MLPIALLVMSRGAQPLARQRKDKEPTMPHQPGPASAPVRRPPETLSRREVEVLCLIAEGRSNRAIAEALSVSERTVTTHVFHIMAKLDLTSRTAAAVYAVRNGLV